MTIRVIFARGSIRMLDAELERLGVRKVLVLSSADGLRRIDKNALNLGARSAAQFAGAVMHTPIAVTEKAMQTLAASGADGLLTIGGSSTTGLGKALALRTGLPLLAVPTTYAGSEMTPLLGETQGNQKTTTRDPRVLPRTVIYDVDLTYSLSPAISVASGINAIAHAVEAVYARDANPVTSLIAVDAIALMAQALPSIVKQPSDSAARSNALRGAWQAGLCLASVGMGLHHKLCHTLGGLFNLPHAQTHCVVLPHAAAYNAPAVPDAMQAVGRALGTSHASRGLYDLVSALGAPTSLRELGMPEHGIESAAHATLANPYWNPRPLEYAAVRQLLQRAWSGDPPAEQAQRSTS
jgi:alcohol dehydrogenase class IV